jgi:5-methylcytosine-specific restriction endonuclease McrA
LTEYLSSIGYSLSVTFCSIAHLPPFNGDIVYWSKRKSKYYDGMTAKALTKQEHKCGYCGLRFIDNEDIHLHHIDGNHNNWKPNNLMAVHQSCHQYIHTSKREA